MHTYQRNFMLFDQQQIARIIQKDPGRAVQSSRGLLRHVDEDICGTTGFLAREIQGAARAAPHLVAVPTCQSSFDGDLAVGCLARPL